MSDKTKEEKAKDENSRLVDDFCSHLTDAYGCEPHAKYTPNLDGSMDVITDYEPMKFSSFRVLLLSKGTVLRDSILLIEQLIITLIFVGFALPVYVYFGQDLGADRHGAVSVRVWLQEQEGKMRAFAMIMTTLAAFLLTFYTSMAVGRWWTMRCGGVGGIKKATVELEMYICQLVTREPEVLSAIRRYGRTSLVLIYLWRSGRLDTVKQRLVQHDLLTQHEADQLHTWNHCLHETIWAWQTGIVTMLWKEGKIKSDQLFNLLLERCSDGRAAVQLVHTHLAVRIPMQYVHLLGLLVKMHNTVLAMIMGILFGAAVRNGEVIICIQCFARTLILPFLFNAILLINCELSDPFEGNMTDFPVAAYEKNLDKDCQGVIAASMNMPDWLQARTGLA